MSNAPDLTIQEDLRLQEIFLPYYTKKRKQLFGERYEKPSANFVHYTSADAALKIIRSKRLWMRNTACMDDYREVQHGFKIVHDFFANDGYKAEFSSSVDECVPGGLQDALARFDKIFNDVSNSIYISSLSRHCESEDLHGRLSMWRAFGSAGPRVALVFNVPAISQGAVALRIMFSPVSYLPDMEVHKSLLQTAANIKNERAFLKSLDPNLIVAHLTLLVLAAVTCSKHQGFHEEEEWRAVYFQMKDVPSLMESSLESPGGIPQLVYKIPLDGGVNSILDDLDLSRILTRVIVGPTQFGPAVAASFVAELFQLGVPDADKRVVLSGIPIRS